MFHSGWDNFLPMYHNYPALVNEIRRQYITSPQKNAYQSPKIPIHSTMVANNIPIQRSVFYNF